MTNDELLVEIGKLEARIRELKAFLPPDESALYEQQVAALGLPLPDALSPPEPTNESDEGDGAEAPAGDGERIFNSDTHAPD